MSLVNLIGGALVSFGVAKTGDWALASAKQRREIAMQRRNEWTNRYVGKLMRKTADLDRRIAALQSAQERVEASLEDPHFWSTFEKATIEAGLTDDDSRHEVLARAVIERLNADPDSTAAVASAQAVEVLGRLAKGHLDLLETAAVVYAIRPPFPDPEEVTRKATGQLQVDSPDAAKARNRAEQQALREVVEPYVEWLRDSLGGLPIPEARPSDIVTAHLESASAIIFDRTDERDLLQTLAPWRDQPDHFFSYHAAQPLRLLVEKTELGWRLGRFWDEWLQYVTITPAGLLIGSAVNDARRGTTMSVDLDRSTYASAGRTDRKLIWDGREITEGFMDALEKKIRDYSERRVGIWDRLRRR